MTANNLTESAAALVAARAAAESANTWANRRRYSTALLAFRAAQKIWRVQVAASRLAAQADDYTPF